VKSGKWVCMFQRITASVFSVEGLKNTNIETLLFDVRVCLEEPDGGHNRPKLVAQKISK
jgi:hypothetical protein